MVTYILIYISNTCNSFWGQRGHLRAVITLKRMSNKLVKVLPCQQHYILWDFNFATYTLFKRKIISQSKLFWCDDYNKIVTSLDSNGGQVQRDDDDHDVAQGDAGTTVVVVAGDGGELGGGENWTLLSLSLWVSAIIQWSLLCLLKRRSTSA